MLLFLNPAAQRRKEETSQLQILDKLEEQDRITFVGFGAEIWVEKRSSLPYNPFVKNIRVIL